MDKFIFDGLFGLERETHRVTADGRLAQTEHPFNDKFLDKDFCESQLELITPPCESTKALMDVLSKLDSKARTKLAEKNEYIWLYSNPPHIESEKEIKIAEYPSSHAFKHDYRIKLERRYGKKLMLYSGIHFNFSFSDKYIESISDGKEGFKDELYFRLSKQISRYSWLLVLLTAASPVFDRSLENDGLSGVAFDGYASRRSGEKGYWNQFVPVLDYTDLRSYVDSINRYLSQGALFSASELYLPVRIKSKTAAAPDQLLVDGIDHIELRMFDINPLAPLGVFIEDLDFAHYFLIYLSGRPDFEYTKEMQERAIKDHHNASRYELDDIEISGKSAREMALNVLDDMEMYFKDYSNVLKSVEYQKRKITDDERYCKKVYDMFYENYNDSVMKVSKG